MATTSNVRKEKAIAPKQSKRENLSNTLWAHANDDGFQFVLPAAPLSLASGPAARITKISGGFCRNEDQGHLISVVGRGGTGKSILAMQLVTHLLKDANSEQLRARWNKVQRPTAFYFTLESTPQELLSQVRRFKWGVEYEAAEESDVTLAVNNSGNLRIVPMPSPVQSLTGLTLQIRQSIASALDSVGELAAIVIDPLGGIVIGSDFSGELNQLKQLCDSHRTFLFLLVEDHIFKEQRSVEHFSQSVIHLEHDPRQQPSRTLYIQKARGQNFRTGFHQFEIQPPWGVQVYPSVQAQSAYAHEQYTPLDRGSQGRPDPPSAPLLPLDPIRHLPEGLRKVQRGSVIFLIGPPGTFKQFIATSFCSAVPGSGSIYISFKADQSDVQGLMEGRGVAVDTWPGNDANDRMRFLDARNPLSTPEEILSKVRQQIQPNDRRAVVWGLRRLADMPNYSGKAVQFLEALVTLFKAHDITSLLVDWPDISAPSMLPIVDLSQYILLTRLCRARSESLPQRWKSIWRERKNVALLRVQRDSDGFHRDQGVLLFSASSKKKQRLPEYDLCNSREFEAMWRALGVQWEMDPGLSTETDQ